MEHLELTECQAGALQGYEDLVLKLRVVKTREQAPLAALLWCALDLGTPAQVEKILAAGATPNVVYPRGSTPLGLAFARFRQHDERVKVVRLLLAAGADPSVPSERESPLVIASRAGPDEAFALVLTTLKEAGKMSPSEANRALLQTVVFRCASAVTELIKCGAAVNHCLSFSASALPDVPLSPLMVAACFRRPEVVQILLQAGADVNLKDAEGHTALDYARFDPKPSRKVIALLEQCGAVSGNPFPLPDEALPNFTQAAKTPAFRKAVATIRKLTGMQPQPLVGADGTIPGGCGFLLDDNPSKTFVEGGLSEHLGVRDRARQFVEQHQADMLAQGAYLFHTRDLTKQNGTAVALLPTTDVYRVIAAVQTEGPNSNVSNDDLIAWLRNLEKDVPFLITGVGADFLEGKFLNPIQEPAALVKRIKEICPGDVFQPGDEQRAIDYVQQTNRLFLWWD